MWALAQVPCGLWVERIHPLGFLARHHKRQLNQALSCLLAYVSFECVLCRMVTFCVKILCLLFDLVRLSLPVRLTGKDRLQNDLFCVRNKYSK